MWSILNWLLPILLAVIGIWVFLPRAAQLFAARRQKVYFEDADVPVFNRLQTTDAKDISDELEKLGFKKLGIRTNKALLWSPANREIVFASEKEGAFAAVFPFSNRVVYSFFTPFKDGQSVLTTYRAFRSMETEDTIIDSCKEGTAEELLERHRESVEKFRSRGMEPIEEFNQQSRLDFSLSFYNSSEALSSMRKMGLFYSILVLICIIPLILAVVNWAFASPAS